MVPHSCLEKADVRTRKKHSQKFRHIGYNIDPYGQSFFPNCISAQWRSEGNWRPGANLNFAPPPSKKLLKNDIEMSGIQLIMCIIISV